MRKIMFLVLTVLSAVSLSACQVNWFDKTIEVPWYVVALPTILILFVSLAVAYRVIFSRTYVCPICKTEIKPKWNDFSLSVHVNGKRLAKCPHCGKKSFCEPKSKQ